MKSIQEMAYEQMQQNANSRKVVLPAPTFESSPPSFLQHFNNLGGKEEGLGNEEILRAKADAYNQGIMDRQNTLINEYTQAGFDRLAETNKANATGEPGSAAPGATIMPNTPNSPYNPSAKTYDIKTPNPKNTGSFFTVRSQGTFNPNTGLRGHKNFRNNNPGNISAAGFNKPLYGAIGIELSSGGKDAAADNRMFVFRDRLSGTRAMHTMMSGKRYNSAPIAKAFDQYQSDKKAYRQLLDQYRKAGINVDSLTYNQLNPQQKMTFMQLRANKEGNFGKLPNIF